MENYVTAAERAATSVMKKNRVWRSVLDVSSWFAGSYAEMALCAEYAAEHGYELFYDPGKLMWSVDQCGNWLWYRIETPGGEKAAEGYEPCPERLLDDRQMIMIVQSRWERLDKPAPRGSDRRLAEYLRVPRKAFLTQEECRASGILKTRDEKGIATTESGIEISEEYMYRWDLRDLPE